MKSPNPSVASVLSLKIGTSADHSIKCTIGSMLQDDKDSGVQEINENFDRSFQDVARAVRSAAKELASQELKTQLVNFPLGVGVMVANPN